MFNIQHLWSQLSQNICAKVVFCFHKLYIFLFDTHENTCFAIPSMMCVCVCVSYRVLQGQQVGIRMRCKGHISNQKSPAQNTHLHLIQSTKHWNSHQLLCEGVAGNIGQELPTFFLLTSRSSCKPDWDWPRWGDSQQGAAPQGENSSALQCRTSGE